MSRNADIYSMGMFVGILNPDSVARIGPFPYMSAVQIKGLGSTIGIGGYQTQAEFGTTIGFSFQTPAGPTTAGGTFIIGASFTSSYIMPPNEVFAGNVSGYFYVYSAAATITYNVLIGKTVG